MTGIVNFKLFVPEFYCLTFNNFGLCSNRLLVYMNILLISLEEEISKLSVKANTYLS